MMKDLFSYLTSVYLFMMLAVFPLYVRKGFVLLAAYKVVFYRNISLFVMAGAVVLGIAALIQNRGKASRETSTAKMLWTKLKKMTSIPDYAILAFGIWNVISFITCSTKADAIRGFGGWEMGLVTQGLMVFGYFLVRLFWDQSKNVWIYTAVALILESILVVLNRTGNDPLGFYKGMDWFEWSRRNLLGTIGNINWLCGYLVCVLPVVMYLYINSRRFYIRLLWGIGLYLSMAAILLQGSRSGILTLVIALFALLFLLSNSLSNITRYLEILFCICVFWAQMTLFRVDLIEPMTINTPQSIYSPLWYIPTVILGVSILCLNLYIHKSGDKILPGWVSVTLKIFPVALLLGGLLVFILCQFSDTVWNAFGAKGMLRITGEWGSNRGTLWKESLRYFLKSGVKNFIFGVGPDCYGPWYLNSGMVITESGVYQDAMFSNAHNEWITTLIQNGAVGLILYLGIFVTAAVSFGKKIRKTPIALVGILTVIMYCTNQFFSFQHICVTPILYIILALCEKDAANTK